jgi:SAM-dependent methyltransferase
MSSGSSFPRYYDAYWSDGGLAPGGCANTDLSKTFSRYVTSATRVLDVGCGDGLTAGVWLHANAGQYIGVDISREAVQLSRARGLDARQINDVTQLPFGDREFDLAVAIEVLEHLLEPQRAAEEIARCLRPGGVLIGQVPNVVHWRHRVRFALRGRFDPMGDRLSAEEPWRDPHIRFFTPNSLGRMLERSGFAHIHIVGTAPRPGLTRSASRRLMNLAVPDILWTSMLQIYPAWLAERLFFIARC